TVTCHGEFLMPRPTDLERAADVRAFYGLDGSTPILAPGYLPSRRDPEGAGKFEKRMRLRLNDLTNSHYGARSKEAAALQAAGLPLIQFEDKDGQWNIDRAQARKEAEIKAENMDRQRAADVRAFYGLDGSAPILARGYLPSGRVAEGAGELEKRMRLRLNDLTDSHYGARSEEAAALQEAALPLIQTEGKDGQWHIGRAQARKEAEIKAENMDRQRAADVRAFYGLDGSAPILARGYLPSGRVAEGAGELEKRMRLRLTDLTNSRYGARSKEAAALQEAALPLIQFEGKDGWWYIDRAQARKVAEIKAEDMDRQRAADVRAFYGLDGSTPILARGYLPSGRVAEGAGELEKRMWLRLNGLTQISNSAGPDEAAALREADLSLKPVEGNGNRWTIVRVPVGQPLNPVSDSRNLHDPGGHSTHGAGSQIAALSQGMAMSLTAPAVPSSYDAGLPAWDAFAVQAPVAMSGGFTGGGGYPGNPVVGGLASCDAGLPAWDASVVQAPVAMSGGFTGGGGYPGNPVVGGLSSYDADLPAWDAFAVQPPVAMSGGFTGGGGYSGNPVVGGLSSYDADLPAWDASVVQPPVAMSGGFTGGGGYPGNPVAGGLSSYLPTGYESSRAEPSSHAGASSHHSRPSSPAGGPGKRLRS
ncbi:hypothetical protein AB0E08_43930, partial [Streptomyces sp. NPDC048281]